MLQIVSQKACWFRNPWLFAIYCIQKQTKNTFSDENALDEQMSWCFHAIRVILCKSNPFSSEQWWLNIQLLCVCVCVWVEGTEMGFDTSVSDRQDVSSLFLHLLLTLSHTNRVRERINASHPRKSRTAAVKSFNIRWSTRNENTQAWPCPKACKPACILNSLFKIQSLLRHFLSILIHVMKRKIIARLVLSHAVLEEPLL